MRCRVPSAAGFTRVGAPERHHKRHRQNSAARSDGRAAAAEFTGTVNTAQKVKKAVTTLLRCYGSYREVTTLRRNRCKPAPLLGFG